MENGIGSESLSPQCEATSSSASSSTDPTSSACTVATSSKLWANNEVTHYGKNRFQQLSSLRKKMFEHKESAGHKAAVKLLAEAEKDSSWRSCEDPGP
jgi:hypothetical protein